MPRPAAARMRSKAFQKAQALAPNDVGLQTRLASARMGDGRSRGRDGRPGAHAATRPEAPQVGEALFFAALATGDLNKAAEAIDKVRAAQGDTPVVRNLEGLLKLAQLDTDGAGAKFRAALKQESRLHAGADQPGAGRGDAGQAAGGGASCCPRCSTRIRQPNRR